MKKFKRVFHNQCSNIYLKLSMRAKCQTEKSRLYKKAYFHNEKYVESLLD